MSSMPTIKWREAIDAADGRDEMILANWQHLAAAAWAGYLKAGRGAVLLDLWAAPVTVQWEYLPLNSKALVESDIDFQKLADYLQFYDPRQEIILIIVSNDWLRLRCLHSERKELLSPSEAYRAGFFRRNDPHLC